MAILVRDAGAEDIPALERLERGCFSTPLTMRQLRAQLPDERHILLAAEESGAVLGYVGLVHVLDEGYISNVAVDAAHRRRGVATALLDELLARAAALRLAFVTLEARASNDAALRLYEKAGFEAVGRRARYYQRPAEDAVLMTYFFDGGEQT